MAADENLENQQNFNQGLPQTWKVSQTTTSVFVNVYP